MRRRAGAAYLLFDRIETYIPGYRFAIYFNNWDLQFLHTDHQTRTSGPIAAKTGAVVLRALQADGDAYHCCYPVVGAAIFFGLLFIQIAAHFPGYPVVCLWPSLVQHG